MLYHLLLLGLWLGTVIGQDSLQAVDDAELAKLAQEEKFVVALLCTEENSERCLKDFALIKMITIKSRCEEFEGELASIREDVIDSLDDGWVVKSVGHHCSFNMIDWPHHYHVTDEGFVS